MTDYIEKNMRAWFRSYPHVQTDALVYAPTGFLWDNAIQSDKSVRIYGEASLPDINDTLDWTDIYKLYKSGQKVEFTNHSTIEPVNKHPEPDISLCRRSYFSRCNEGRYINKGTA